MHNHNLFILINLYNHNLFILINLYHQPIHVYTNGGRKGVVILHPSPPCSLSTLQTSPRTSLPLRPPCYSFVVILHPSTPCPLSTLQTSPLTSLPLRPHPLAPHPLPLTLFSLLPLSPHPLAPHLIFRSPHTSLYTHNRHCIQLNNVDSFILLGCWVAKFFTTLAISIF